MSGQEALRYLGLREKLVLDGERPYSEAIREIEKIQGHSSPQDMVACLSSSFGSLKSAVVDHYKGKFELESMDEVLPLSIYCVAMADLSHPASHRNMMEDYLRANPKGFDLERKLLCNFDCAVRYVASEWELPAEEESKS